MSRIHLDRIASSLAALLFASGVVSADSPVGTTFTYQGVLEQNGTAVEGGCCFDVGLWTAADQSGALLGSYGQCMNITDGLLTFDLDFGADAFKGKARWLEIAVCCDPDDCSNPPVNYTVLSPRQGLTPTPYALALPGVWTDQNNDSPSVLGGYHGNEIVGAEVVGGTIGGGGESGLENRVSASWGTVGGGSGNTAAGLRSTVGGGWLNTAGENYATIAGGSANMASGILTAVGGGSVNVASGIAATVPGGSANSAGGSFSFAAGNRAKAQHDGAFVWADSTDEDFASTDPDQFLIRASGGVGIGTTTPSQRLSVFDGNLVLQVADNANDQAILFQNSGANYTWRIYRSDAGNRDADLHFAGGQDTSDFTLLPDRMTIDNGGNVGIGTPTPNSKLEVAGVIHSTSAGFKFPDGTVQSSAAIGAAGGTGARTPLQIALLRWYEANESGATFNVGSFPRGVAFDGAHIWVTNSDSDNVTKLRASDGAVLGTFNVGNHPQGVAFDGTHIWVANIFSDNVTKLRASDGAVLGTFNVGDDPQAVAFDGANVWVPNAGSDNVTKLRASDGTVQGTFNVGNVPAGVAFDGANIWVTNNGSDNVTKLRASDGAVLGTFNVGDAPLGVAFDGANIWVANLLSNNVTKLRASDGAVLGTFNVGTAPSPVAFDGANIWVANFGGDNVTKLRASDGAVLGTFNVGDAPLGVAFDGANIWVTNSFDHNVAKL